MRNIERDIDRFLTALRDAMRRQGFTQLEVQENLGWGRSYISQLLTKQKSLRFDHILNILHVIGVKPEEYFAAVYPGIGEQQPARRASRRAMPLRVAARAPSPFDGSPFDLDGDSSMHADAHRLKLLVKAVVEVLVQRDVIDRDELAKLAAKNGHAPSGARRTGRRSS